MRPRHLNKAVCESCNLKLVGVDPRLAAFALEFRKANPDAHISWGLRGRKDQEDAFNRGHSKARFGQSPHNYGLALDFFRLTLNGADFTLSWYQEKLRPAAEAAGLVSGGAWAKFKDWPHVEVADWKTVNAVLVS